MNTTETSDVRLRLAGRAEIDPAAIAEVVNAAFYLHAFMIGDRTSAEGVLEELGDHGSFVLAEDSQGLVGTALIKPSLDADSEDLEHTVNERETVYIGLVCVAPRVTRSGIGKRLMAEAERIAREQGYARATLGTVREMGNVTYYEAMGYRVVGSQHFPVGHWSLAIPYEHCTMVKDL